MQAPELLMPAGNLEKLKYALAYGADAVYAGMPQFSLRARENGFNEEAIFEGAQYAHQLGRKFYLTANILGHNRKIRPFVNKIDQLMESKPDALIMADPGLICLVKEKYPDVPIHLSVQANVMNWAAVKFWHKIGITRIILSREVSIDEIKEIKEQVPEMELEAFVHGAICIAHSGRCLLSNYFNHRDANQGMCTNACRWPYKLYAKKDYQDDDLINQYDVFGDFYLEEKNRPGELMRIDEDEFGTYIMNAKDLMAIEHLKEMMDAGVESFKVEGRTKSIYYLSLTTRAYRRAIDDLVVGKPFDQSLVDELKKLHHRGYTPGFLTQIKDSQLQNYENGVGYYDSQEFGGVVVESDPERILVSARNRLRVADTIEIISPKDSFYTKIDSLITKTDKSVEVIHPGGLEAWIPVPKGPVEEYSLVSRKL